MCVFFYFDGLPLAVMDIYDRFVWLHNFNLLLLGQGFAAAVVFNKSYSWPTFAVFLSNGGP